MCCNSGIRIPPYIYSSRQRHQKSLRLPSRPDKHEIVTITIPLQVHTEYSLINLSLAKLYPPTQLTTFNIVSTHNAVNPRLLSTVLASFLSLTRFHLTLLSQSSSRWLHAGVSLEDGSKEGGSGLGSGTGTAPMLLALMTLESATPLMRRGYGELMWCRCGCIGWCVFKQSFFVCASF